jgi:hypothetical protein
LADFDPLIADDGSFQGKRSSWMRARSVHAFQHEDSQERRGARSLSFGLEPKLFRVALCHYFATTGRCIIQLSNGATYGPFTLANGPQGPQGNPGDTGAQGPQGDPGAPGEVTSSDLGTAIGGTSANTNTVSQLGMTVSDPPTQSDLQAVANKLDELIAALRR